MMARWGDGAAGERLLHPAPAVITMTTTTTSDHPLMTDIGGAG